MTDKEVEIEIDETVPAYMRDFLKRPTIEEVAVLEREKFLAFKQASVPQLTKQKAAMEELISLGLSEDTARLLTCFYEHDEQFLVSSKEIDLKTE